MGFGSNILLIRENGEIASFKQVSKTGHRVTHIFGWYKCIHEHNLQIYIKSHHTSVRHI